MFDEPKRRYVLVVSLWLRNNDIAAFEDFERRASKLLARHGGKIERVIRSLNASDVNVPFEIHIVTFPNQQTYASYLADPAVQALAGAREKVVSRTSILEGSDLGTY